LKARIDGGDVCYEERGEGPAVVFLHAFPLSASMWDAQCEALSQTHRVLRFDARGFGGSTPGELAFTMDRIADDAATLLERLGVERAVVAGCSMGGYAALAFARRHAGRLAGLVLLDTKAGPDTEEARASRRALAARVLAEGAAAAVDAFLPKLVGETTQRSRPQVVDRVRAAILAAPPRAVADALHGLAAREDSRPGLGLVRVPTLVVVGEEDVLTPPSEAESLAGAIPGARLVRVPGAGHLANLEDPGAVNAALRGFLGTSGR
jgi:pimeloyl-ACP methyl ester carboxylesterase